MIAALRAYRHWRVKIPMNTDERKKRCGNNIYTNMTCHRYDEGKKRKMCNNSTKKISSNKRIKLCIWNKNMWWMQSSEFSLRTSEASSHWQPNSSVKFECVRARKYCFNMFLPGGKSRIKEKWLIKIKHIRLKCHLHKYAKLSANSVKYSYHRRLLPFFFFITSIKRKKRITQYAHE